MTKQRWKKGDWLVGVHNYRGTISEGELYLVEQVRSDGNSMTVGGLGWDNGHPYFRLAEPAEVSTKLASVFQRLESHMEGEHFSLLRSIWFDPPKYPFVLIPIGSKLQSGDLVSFGASENKRAIDPECYGNELTSQDYAKFWRLQSRVQKSVSESRTLDAEQDLQPDGCATVDAVTADSQKTICYPDLDVGEGYRRLQLGEIVQEGDEGTYGWDWNPDGSRRWFNVQPHTVGKQVHDDMIPIRRKMDK